MRFELTPVNGRQSFYGKCYVEQNDGICKLYSYDTLVMSIDRDKQLHRHWDGESQTTMSHIKSFVAYYLGIEPDDFPLSRYRSMEVEEEY